MRLDLLSTLESGIDVATWINVAPGTLGKNNKRSPENKHSNPFKFFFLPNQSQKSIKGTPKIQKLINVAHFNKDVAPGKKLKK